MRKISKSRADDDVVSSTNGSGSVAYEERQADEPNDQEVDEKSPDEEVDDADDYVEARKKGKYKSKSKASKRKSDRNSNKKDEEDEEAEYEDNDREVDEDNPDEDEDTDDYEESRKKGKKSKNKSSKKRKSDRNSIKKDEEDDEEAEYEVEKIIDSKRIKGKLHYLIRWKGYSASNDTWEPDNTLSCPELISKYNEEKENSKNNSPKKASKRKGSKKASKSSPAKKPKTVWDEKNVDENAEYEVERILEVHHKKNGERSFLIHWKGWSNKFDSWEPESNLNCPELIKRFMDKVSAARATDSRNLRVAPETTNRFTLQAPSSGRRLSKRRGQRQRVRYDNAE